MIEGGVVELREGYVGCVGSVVMSGHVVGVVGVSYAVCVYLRKVLNQEG